MVEFARINRHQAKNMERIKLEGLIMARKSAMDILNQRNRILGSLKSQGTLMTNGAIRTKLSNRFNKVNSISKKYIKNITGSSIANSLVLNNKRGNTKVSRSTYMGLSNG